MTPPAVATIGKSSRPACVSTASGALSRVVTPGMGWNLCVGGICSGLINKNHAVDPESARRVTVDQPVLALQRLKLPDRSLTTAAFSTSHSPSTSGPLPLFMSRMTLGEVLQLLLVPLLRPLLRRVRRELLVSLGIHEARTIWCCFLNWRCYPSDVPSGRRNSPAKTAHQALGTRRRLFSYAFRGADQPCKPEANHETSTSRMASTSNDIVRGCDHSRISRKRAFPRPRLPDHPILPICKLPVTGIPPAFELLSARRPSRRTHGV